MTVGELLDRISSTELAEWAVYERDYGPLGPSRHDHLAALVASTVANTASSKTRFKPADFLPKWGGRRRRQTGREQLDILRTFIRQYGSQDPQT